MKQKFSIKELLRGMLCGVAACLFVMGLIPGYQLISVITGAIIACTAIYYIIKHKPATWFIVGFAVPCIILALFFK